MNRNTEKLLDHSSRASPKYCSLVAALKASDGSVPLRLPPLPDAALLGRHLGTLVSPVFGVPHAAQALLPQLMQSCLPWPSETVEGSTTPLFTGHLEP